MLLLALLTFCLAVGYWVYASVKRDGGDSPVARGMGITAILFVTPFVAFFMIAVSLTGGLPPVIGVVPVALLGLGLYVFVTGTVPARPRLTR